MDMRIVFSGGKKVDALYKGFTVKTDQPEGSGGDNTAASPFDLFLCSIGTCAGFYVLSFCQERGIPEQGIELVLKQERNQETGLIGRIGIEIQLPPEFPAQYQEAVLRVASLCTVKKHLAHPPEFDIYTTSKA